MASIMENLLWWSSYFGNLEQVKQCIEAGEDVNLTTESGSAALITSSSKGHYLVVKYLLENGATVDKRTKSGFSAFFFACAWNHKEIASLLLMYDADSTFVGQDGDSAEKYALIHGWNFDEMIIQASYKSPFYLDRLFLCIVINEERDENCEKDGEKIMSFLLQLIKSVHNYDIFFTENVIPSLFNTPFYV